MVVEPEKCAIATELDNAEPESAADANNPAVEENTIVVDDINARSPIAELIGLNDEIAAPVKGIDTVIAGRHEKAKPTSAATIAVPTSTAEVDIAKLADAVNTAVPAIDAEDVRARSTVAASAAIPIKAPPVELKLI